MPRKYGAGTGKKSITACKPLSLTKYEELRMNATKLKFKFTVNRNNAGSLNENEPLSEEIEEKCWIELDIEDDGKKNVQYYKKLDDKLKVIFIKLKLDTYKRGEMAADFDKKFIKASSEFARLFFPSSLPFADFTKRLALAKDHEDLNEVFLNYATSIAIMKRPDCENFLASPLDTYGAETFFPRKVGETAAEARERDKGSDYQRECPNPLCIPESGELDLTGGDQESHSLDPEEQKMDHFREDSNLHIFHTIYHTLFTAQRANRRLWPRMYEQFFFTHGQMMRRMAVGRRALGVAPLRPLDLAALRRPLGPGFRTGWYSWEGLGNRCVDSPSL
jgi:hypothetical protein